METYGVTTNPILMPGNVEPRYSEFVTFIGIGVDHDTDTQLYNDATVAYRNACLNAVTYLQKFGYSGRAGLPAARRRTDRGPGQWRRRHPERLLLALPADRDLRLRHPPVGVRPGHRRPRQLRGLVVARNEPKHPARVALPGCKSGQREDRNGAGGPVLIVAKRWRELDDAWPDRLPLVRRKLVRLDIDCLGADFNARPRTGTEVVYPRRVDGGPAVGADDEQSAVDVQGSQWADARLARSWRPWCAGAAGVALRQGPPTLPSI